MPRRGESRTTTPPSPPARRSVLGLGLKNSGLGNGFKEISRRPSSTSAPTASSRSATAGPRWARACTPWPCRWRSRSSGIDPVPHPGVSSTRVASSELGQTTGSRGTLMGGRIAVKAACEAARAGGCEIGYRLRGRVPGRLDHQARAPPGSRTPSSTPRSRYAAQMTVIADRDSGAGRAGRRRHTTSVGPSTLMLCEGQVEGVGAHGAGVRPDRGLPPPIPRPASRLATTLRSARHPAPEGRPGDRGGARRERRSPTRRTA